MPLSNYGKIPYYKTNNVLWRWTLCDGNVGCQIVPDVNLSSDKAPPALRDQSQPPPVPKEPRNKKEVGDGLLAVLEATARFRKWLDTPGPPKPPTAAQAARADAVPVFDIQEIPGAMRKNFMSKSAMLMEKWFAGELNYSSTDSDEKAEINQDGKPYPPSMYDTTTIKLDWVLNFRRAKDQYDALVNTAIRSPRAMQQLALTLSRYKRSCAELDTWDFSGKRLANLHRHFQFQHVGVESTLSQKISQFIASNMTNGGTPDDLTGALGSFNFYAAIAYAEFNSDATAAKVKGIYVYVRDNYTFTDKLGEASQYLGHWSRNGVVIVPYNAGASILDKPWLPYVDYPVAVGDVRVSGNIYYPVKNSSFRQWAMRHKRGGDFVVYSDCRFVPIYPPMTVHL
ncbi:DUF6402 family protein [Paraburkholderia sp.]|uniref:DUF6402 family protein n=1 Tax=Paraburkholderia sp. TaxID=1926495 RepID=UPI002D2940F4|nr:DUF6402 family protein [Paraburkholderia sp.]HZZ06220.1 DUF6402 family protein [Paraburkholderia sp.]